MTKLYLPFWLIFLSSLISDDSFVTTRGRIWAFQFILIDRATGYTIAQLFYQNLSFLVDQFRMNECAINMYAYCCSSFKEYLYIRRWTAIPFTDTPNSL